MLVKVTIKMIKIGIHVLTCMCLTEISMLQLTVLVIPSIVMVKRHTVLLFIFVIWLAYIPIFIWQSLIIRLPKKCPVFSVVLEADPEGRVALRYDFVQCCCHSFWLGFSQKTSHLLTRCTCFRPCFLLSSLCKAEVIDFFKPAGTDCRVYVVFKVIYILW